MAERYSERIKAYCADGGIEIPPGFRRHPASRYAAVELGTSPPKLVATTWLKQEDVVYFLDHLGAGRSFRILDFKERRELRRIDQRLEAGDPF
jgi:hypothetical protein